MKAVIERAIEILRAGGVDARLSEIWRGGERHYCIVLLNVHSLEEEGGDGTED